MHVNIDEMRRYMDQIGVKQGWVANKAGMTQNAMNLVMNKKRTLKADEYLAICEVLNMPLDSFVDQIS